MPGIKRMGRNYVVVAATVNDAEVGFPQPGNSFAGWERAAEMIRLWSRILLYASDY